MCLTSEPSRMSNTIVYAAETAIDGTLHHVLAYQNRAASKGPNAMLLPIPSDKPLGPMASIDMTPYKTVLTEYAEAFQPRRRSMTKGLDRDVLLSKPHVYDVGSYTVVLAQDADAIPSVLAQVRQDRRPRINAALFHDFGRRYPGHHIALCCFNGEIEAEPIAFVYEPINASRLFLPGLDGHDGQAPRDGQVPRDHTLIWGHPSLRERMAGNTLRDGSAAYGHRVATTTRMPPDIAQLFPRVVQGTTVRGLTRNGDWHLLIKDLGTIAPTPVISYPDWEMAAS